MRPRCSEQASEKERWDKAIVGSWKNEKLKFFVRAFQEDQKIFLCTLLLWTPFCSANFILKYLNFSLLFLLLSCSRVKLMILKRHYKGTNRFCLPPMCRRCHCCFWNGRFFRGENSNDEECVVFIMFIKVFNMQIIHRNCADCRENARERAPKNMPAWNERKMRLTWNIFSSLKFCNVCILCVCGVRVFA